MGDMRIHRLCQASIRQLQRVYPEAAIHLVSDVRDPLRDVAIEMERDMLPGFTHSMVPRAEGYETREVKTTVYNWSPYESTLFMDVDTFVNRNLDDLFLLIKDSDLAMVLEPHQSISAGIDDGFRYGYISQAEAEATLAVCGESFPYFNSGVMFFRRNQRVADFFRNWNQEWRRFRQRDQFALSRALAGSSVRLAILPSAFNFFAMPHVSTATLRKQSILHFWFGEKLERWLAYEKNWLETESKNGQ